MIQSITKSFNFEALGKYSNFAQTFSPVIQKIAHGAKTVFFEYYPLYSLYESAFSNILCLKTFRHGSNPYALMRIGIEGNDPQRGGQGGEASWWLQVNGEKSPYADRDSACFYVVEDICDKTSTYDYRAGLKHKTLHDSKGSLLDFITDLYYTRIAVKYYSLRSNVSFFTKHLPLPFTWKANLMKLVVTTLEGSHKLLLLGSLISPTIKFHIHPNRIAVLQTRRELLCGRMYARYPNTIFFARDEGSTPRGAFAGALVTHQKFSVLDIGILGVLKNGLNLDAIKRIQENKGQFIYGVAQLISAIAITTFYYPRIIPSNFNILSLSQKIESLVRSPKIQDHLMAEAINRNVINGMFWGKLIMAGMET